MITFIVTETRENYERGNNHPVKIKLEKISKLPCLVQYYADVTLKKVMALGIKAVVFSGYSTPLDDHKLDTFQGIYDLARRADLPMIGFCGGHQLLAELWAPHNNNGLTRMSGYTIRKLRKGEPDHNPAYHPGDFKEWGFYPITIVRRDPLFAGLKSGFMCCQYHRCEVKVLPKDFLLLAGTRDVRVQAFRHKSRLLYGVQFHPENWTDYYPAGRRVIKNFFSLAGIL